MRHMARVMSYDDLYEGLEAARSAGFVRRRDKPGTGLSLYVYSEACVYDRAWNDHSLLARGLILDTADRRVVATPFPKFFNLGERGEAFPDQPFQVFEKLDGSLIILFHHDGGWQAVTKGAFDSSQAQWAQARLDGMDLSALTTGTTYLAEAVYPENRIVVLYTEPALVLLAAYREDGVELTHEEILETCAHLGWRAALRHDFASVSDLVARSKSLPKTEEGYVLRFADGHRLKVKGEEYRRIHALISNCTPLAMWEAMLAGDDMEAIRRDLPEEFWTDFDRIIGLLSSRRDALTHAIAATADSVAHLSDKELGLSLASLPEGARSFVFPYRKGGGVIRGKLREGIYRAIRPTGNELEGYMPSYAMRHAMDEAT